MRKILCITALSVSLMGGAIALPDTLPAKETTGTSAPKFQAVPFPHSDADKRSILASPRIVVDGKSHKIAYNTILRSGQKAGEGTFGLLLDANNRPITNTDGSHFISQNNDFNSLISVGSKLYMISHFEGRPGAMYLTELNQDSSTGKLSPKSTRNIDFSAFGGLWVPCAGSVTPWNSHLGGEEYPTDAAATQAAKSMDDIEDYDKPMARYFGLDPYAKSTTVTAFTDVFKPYQYGYPTEVTVNEKGETAVAKHFSMGRVAVELSFVMPDSRTAYISDDGTNVGFFMYIADVPEDLSSGTLYAAQWNQVHGSGGGYADIEWINLGHANDATIAKAIKEDIQFSDIFNSSHPLADNSCEENFTSIHTTTGQECLQVKPGMEILASRLETRRFAAMKGATTEFRKEEGISYDPQRKVLYVAMSQISKGMETASKYDAGGPDQIRLNKNSCGAVYGMDIGPDSSVGSDYVAGNMYEVLAGRPRKYPEDSLYAGNECDIDGIANPDNITFMVGRNTLIIGEDSGSGHQNDAIWAFNVGNRKLTRIQTTPYGSETTSPYFYPNINGWGYLMSVVQHPYGESDSDKLIDPADLAGYTGYIGPFPAMD